MMKLLSILSIVVICFVNITVQEDDDEDTKLPKYAIPQKYDLYLITDLDYGQFRFHGKVTIKVSVII